MEHHFKVEDAKLYGIECAILLYNIRFWIEKNKANGKHFYNGKFWTYNSARAFSELFPYLSRPQIARHLRNLEDLGVLESGTFNNVGYDKTKWYTVNETPCTNLNNDCTELNNDCSKMNNGLHGNEQPIPYNKTDDKTDIYERLKNLSFKQWDIDDFKYSIVMHSGNYSRDLLYRFYNYWSEKSPSGKMKFQLERTWETDRRLITWKNSPYNKTTTPEPVNRGGSSKTREL